MKTLVEVLKLSQEYLRERNVANPRREAEELFSSLLKLKRMQLYLQFDRPMEEPELVVLRQLLKRRSEGEPIAYLFEEVEFYRCTLHVSRDVLIPRQETEIFVDKACQVLPKGEKRVVWDLCTGSGCIGLNIKKVFPAYDVTLSDLSPGALAIAKKNSLKNRCEVELVQGDLLAPFEGKKADIVFCNPPYVSEKEYLSLDREVRSFEPKMALVGGETGLEFYERLARELPGYLNPGAKVFFEIGAGQGEGVLQLFNASCWKRKLLERDWAGHDRFFFLEFE